MKNWENFGFNKKLPSLYEIPLHTLNFEVNLGT